MYKCTNCTDVQIQLCTSVQFIGDNNFDVKSVQDCSDSGVQPDNQAVQLNSKLNTNLNTHLNTLPQEETAGSNTVSVIKGGVQNMSRPKNIDDSSVRGRDTVKFNGVKNDNLTVKFDVKVDSDFDTNFYTHADGKSTGRQHA